MNLTKLRNNQIQLIEFMKKEGYSNSHIKHTKREIKNLLKYGEEYDSYKKYYEQFICQNISLKYQKFKRTMLTLIMNFDLYDEYPNRNINKHKIVDYSSYEKLNNYFKNIIDTYDEISKNTNNKISTINEYKLCCSKFLLYLQNLGYENLTSVTEKDVFSFFSNNNFTHSYEKNIKAILIKCIPYINECEILINYFPNIIDKRKNIDYLTNEEIQKIKYNLENNESISLRDKAIISILLYTGLRRCDIAKLQISSINWKEDTIKIIQEKTQVPLELPLTTSVGNSIYKYITTERPKINANNLFIRMDAPLALTSNGIKGVVKRFFKVANIRQNSKRKGTHIFRYNLAINLLENEIPQPIISQVLGHSTSESLKHYLSADFYHLKQCSLDINVFENRKEHN